MSSNFHKCIVGCPCQKTGAFGYNCAAISTGIGGVITVESWNGVPDGISSVLTGVGFIEPCGRFEAWTSNETMTLLAQPGSAKLQIDSNQYSCGATGPTQPPPSYNGNFFFSNTTSNTLWGWYGECGISGWYQISGGTPGPQGPQGATGTTGPQGATLQGPGPPQKGSAHRPTRRYRPYRPTRFNWSARHTRYDWYDWLSGSPRPDRPTRCNWTTRHTRCNRYHWTSRPDRPTRCNWTARHTRHDWYYRLSGSPRPDRTTRFMDCKAYKVQLVPLVPKARQVHKVQLDLKAYKVRLVRLALRVLKARQVHKVQLGRRVYKVRLVPLVPKAKQVHKVQRPARNTRCDRHHWFPRSRGSDWASRNDWYWCDRRPRSSRANSGTSTTSFYVELPTGPNWYSNIRSLKMLRESDTSFIGSTGITAVIKI